MFGFWVFASVSLPPGDGKIFLLRWRQDEMGVVIMCCGLREERRRPQHFLLSSFLVKASGAQKCLSL